MNNELQVFKNSLTFWWLNPRASLNYSYKKNKKIEKAKGGIFLYGAKKYEKYYKKILFRMILNSKTGFYLERKRKSIIMKTEYKNNRVDRIDSIEYLEYSIWFYNETDVDDNLAFLKELKESDIDYEF